MTPLNIDIRRNVETSPLYPVPALSVARGIPVSSEIGCKMEYSTVVPMPIALVSVDRVKIQYIIYQFLRHTYHHADDLQKFPASTPVQRIVNIIGRRRTEHNGTVIFCVRNRRFLLDIDKVN